MKFMKLGSKPDKFQSDGDNIRYVATELATDMVINVRDVKFFVHKFPLLSKSLKLQKLAGDSSKDNNDEIIINGIPGGPPAFEICAKFCYGMVVTLNAYNVVAARCAAEFLGMHETLEKGNLIYKIDVFLSSGIFRSWKDSIIVLQTTKSFLPWSEELKLISHSVDSIAVKASTDTSNVEWSYTYNRKKLLLENAHDPHWNGVKKQQNVPKDWWVEDLCELPVDLFKRVITTVRVNENVPADVIGESLKVYALRWLPVLSPNTKQGGDLVKFRYLVDTIAWLLPKEKNSIPCSFLLKLLQTSIVLECGETRRRELIQKIAQQLQDATLTDLLVPSPTGEMALYNIEIINDLVELFVRQEHSSRTEPNHPEFQDIHPGITSDASKRKVARLVDDYLAEAARDPSLPLDRFVNLAAMVSGFPRSSHDGIYRAIDMYLKEHRELTKSEKRRICGLMDPRKLSAKACSHAVQNERLPLRVVVQILFFEQARATGNNNTAGFPSSVRALFPSSSCGSSISATSNSDEDWDANQTSKEIEEPKRAGTTNDVKSSSTEKETPKKVQIFSRLWSTKDRPGENSSSDTSDSAVSTSVEEMKDVGEVKDAGRILTIHTQKKLHLTR